MMTFGPKRFGRINEIRLCSSYVTQTSFTQGSKKTNSSNNEGRCIFLTRRPIIINPFLRTELVGPLLWIKTLLMRDSVE